MIADQPRNYVLQLLCCGPGAQWIHLCYIGTQERQAAMHDDGMALVSIFAAATLTSRPSYQQDRVHPLELRINWFWQHTWIFCDLDRHQNFRRR